MKLSTLSVLLGTVVALLNLWGLLKPAAFTAAARKFPRSVPIGCVLMLIATAWFIINLKNENISDFESLKKYLFYLFAAVGLGTCVFVQDFLAVRGLAVVLLLVAKLMLDLQRWLDTDWRLVIAVWAYLFVIAGIWFTISPWRLRDLINWGTASLQRVRILSGIRLAFGLLVVALGLLVFP